MKVEAITFVAIEPVPQAIEGAAFDEAMSAIENEAVVADEAQTDREAEEKEPQVDASLVAMFAVAPPPDPPDEPRAVRVNQGGTQGTEGEDVIEDSPRASSGAAASSSCSRVHHGGTEEEEVIDASPHASSASAASSSSSGVHHGGTAGTEGEDSIEASPLTSSARTARREGTPAAARGGGTERSEKASNATEARSSVVNPENAPSSVDSEKAAPPVNSKNVSPVLDSTNAAARTDRAANVIGHVDRKVAATERDDREANTVENDARPDTVDVAGVADAERIMTAMEPPPAHPPAKSVNVSTIVNAPTMPRDAETTVRAAESAAHKRVLTEKTATGTLTLPELGRVDVEAHAATHERPIFVQVRADQLATTELLANHVIDLQTHVREAAPAANVAIERGFAQNDHGPRDERQPERHDSEDDTRKAPRAFRRTARFVL